MATELMSAATTQLSNRFNIHLFTPVLTLLPNRWKLASTQSLPQLPAILWEIYSFSFLTIQLG